MERVQIRAAVALQQGLSICPIRWRLGIWIGISRPGSGFLHNTGKTPFSLRLGNETFHITSFGLLLRNLPPEYHRLWLDISDILMKPLNRILHWDKPMLRELV